MAALDLGPIVCLAPTGDRCGEGAVWHAGEQAVYWTDINRFLIHRYDARDRHVATWFFAEPVVALSLTDRSDTLLVALGSGLILWRPADDSRIDHGFRLDGWPAVRLNDGRADPLGNFWIGSMRNNVGPEGESGEAGGLDGLLMRIAPGGAVTHWRRDLGCSNTICWNPERTRFYFADTLANVVWEHDYDLADGAIGEPRPFFSGFERGWPDGSVVDSEGCLWNCRYGGGCIVRVRPDGSVDRVIDMPVTNITTAAFGGPELNNLYITTAGAGAPERERLAGSLFGLQTNVGGQPENRYLIG